MAKQTQYCYASYRRLETSTQLHLFGMDAVIQNYKPYLPGLPNWDCVHMNETVENYSERAIYLTAEAEKVLDKVEPGVVYIIGGIVDRNRLPGRCHQRALELNIPQRRLPIQENIQVVLFPHAYNYLLSQV